jgi:hypothetical protein
MALRGQLHWQDHANGYRLRWMRLYQNRHCLSRLLFMWRKTTGRRIWAVEILTPLSGRRKAGRGGERQRNAARARWAQIARHGCIPKAN